MMGLGKAKLCTKFEVASLTHCRNIGEPKILQSADQGHAHFFGWNFMTGLGKPQLHAIFEIAGFIYYGNIRKSVFKRQIRYLSRPLREVGVTYGLYL